jgi:hypothetical protein
MHGDGTLFVREDAVEEDAVEVVWAIIDPILAMNLCFPPSVVKVFCRRIFSPAAEPF